MTDETFPHEMNAPKELYFYDDWLAQHTKGKLLCGNNRYLHENHVDALLKAEREKALREAQERIRKKGNLFSVSVIEAMINRTAKGADL